DDALEQERPAGLADRPEHRHRGGGVGDELPVDRDDGVRAGQLGELVERRAVAHDGPASAGRGPNAGVSDNDGAEQVRRACYCEPSGEPVGPRFDRVSGTSSFWTSASNSSRVSRSALTISELVRLSAATWTGTLENSRWSVPASCVESAYFKART